MIASLSGRLQEVTGDSVILDVGGVGFLVAIPAPWRDHLHAGESIFIHTYLVVRQDALVLFGFEFWAVRRGFRAWSVLAGGEGEVTSAPRRKVWWWILLSYVALAGGVIVSNLLQQLLSA